MRPKKVLLYVDDNEQELSVTKFMLETNGYRVLTATSGQEAISIFNAAPQIDLVLADATMPQMNGRQLVERLKRMKNYVPMMLLGDGQAVGGEIPCGRCHGRAQELLDAGAAGAHQGDERAQARSA